MLEGEIGDGINIESLGWKRTPIGDPSGTFYNFKIYMGYTENDELGENFNNNYSSSRIEVFNRSNFTISGNPEEWVTLDLDTHFFYNGTDNLIIEYEWSSATSESFYIYHWSTGSNRAVRGDYGSSTGVLSQDIQHMQLIGSLSLDSETFARIKVELGN